jgi:hypothetical protein
LESNPNPDKTKSNPRIVIILILFGAVSIGIGIFFLFEWRLSTQTAQVGEIIFNALPRSDIQQLDMFFTINDGKNTPSLLKTELHLNGTNSLNNGSAGLFTDYKLLPNERNSSENCGSYFLDPTDYKSIPGPDNPRVSYNWSRNLCAPANSQVPPGLFPSFFIDEDHITNRIEGKRTFMLNFEFRSFDSERTIEIALPYNAVIIPESLPSISRFRSDNSAVYAMYEIQGDVSSIALSYYLPEELQEYNNASFLCGIFIGLGISASYTGIERRLERR